MKQIKFSIILQHEETGRLVEKIFSYADVFNGTAKRELAELTRYYVIANRLYTGLKDKNGVEIYEGDILEFEYDAEYSFSSKPKKICRAVKWDTYYGASWNFGTSYKDGEKRWSYPAPYDAEVIGNIYENPELLSSKQQ